MYIPPPPPLDRLGPCPPSLPGSQPQSALFATCNQRQVQSFSSVQFFFSRTCRFFSLTLRQGHADLSSCGKNQVTRENFVLRENTPTVVEQPEEPCSTPQIVMLWHFVELQPSAYSKCCITWCNCLIVNADPNRDDICCVLGILCITSARCYWMSLAGWVLLSGHSCLKEAV